MILDVIIVLLILFAAYRGWQKGAVRIIGGLIVLIAAILLASAFGTSFGKAIGIGPTLLHPITGFFILFIILYIIGGFLKRFLTPKSGVFAGANKLVGLVSEVIITVLILGLLFSFFRIFQLPSVKQANQSTVYPVILKSSTLMVSQLKPLVSQLSSEVYDDITPTDSLKK